MRGHAEHLENENAALKMHLVELQQQLRDNDLEPKAAPVPPQNFLQPYWPAEQEQQGAWTGLNNNAALLHTSAPPMSGTGQNERHGSQASLLPEFRQGLIGDNYLGVSSGNSWLSSIEGTSLTLFGMKIDLAEFLPDEDPDSSPMSYKNFISYEYSKQRVQPPSLPSHGQCKVFAEWWFRSCTPFIPVVHKPHFMELLGRIGGGLYQPTPAETVMVHMMLAIMNFQYSWRNANHEAFNTAMDHFRYSLSFVPDLITGHTLPDMQALVLICSQLRSQPRPGAAYSFINTVLGIAVEMGLHRSSNAWQGNSTEQDPHTKEMRKRIFWSLFSLHISVAGKLGRPMALRLQDLDIEIPQALPDYLPEEANLSPWRKCSFQVAPHAMKLLSVMSQVYSTIYSLKGSNEPYSVTVQRLEKEVADVRANMPPELEGGAQTVAEDRVLSLYVGLIENEILLTLHHPSICRTASPQDMQRHLDICLDASNRLLQVAVQMKQLNALDSTWYCTTIHLAAIFTTLFIHTNRQDQMTSADMQRLRSDMDLWLEVMADIGKMLGTTSRLSLAENCTDNFQGSGLRLREAIRGIMDYALGNIQRHIAAKTASAGLASTTPSSAAVEHAQPPHQQQVIAGANGYYNAANGDMANGASPAYPMNNPGIQHPEQNHYQSDQTFYPDPQATSMPPYASASLQAYNNGTYSEPDMKPNIEAQLNAGLQYANPQAQPTPPFNGHPAQNGFQNTPPQAGPTAWRSFTEGVLTNMPSGSDYAQTLMALQNPASHAAKEGTPDIHNSSTMTMAALGGLQHMTAPDGGQPWPLIHYGGTTSNAPGQ